MQITLDEVAGITDQPGRDRVGRESERDELFTADRQVALCLGRIAGVDDTAQVIEPVGQLQQARVRGDLPQPLEVGTVASRLLFVGNLLFAHLLDQFRGARTKGATEDAGIQPITIFQNIVVERRDEDVDVPDTELFPENARYPYRMLDERRALVARLPIMGRCREAIGGLHPPGIVRRHRCDHQRHLGRCTGGAIRNCHDLILPALPTTPVLGMFYIVRYAARRGLSKPSERPLLRRSTVVTYTTTKRQFRISRWTRVLSLLIVTLLFSACINVEIGSEYRLDGSATHSIQIAIPQQPEEGVTTAEVAEFLDDLEEQATDAGFAFSRTESQSITTVRVTGTTSDGQDAGASINGLINATGLNAAPGVAAPFRGTFTRETGAIGGTIYDLSLTVDGQMLFESIAVAATDDQQAALRDALTMYYVATLPGDISETTGERVDDSTVRWQIAPVGETALYAASRTGGSGSAALFIVAGLAAIVVVIVIAAVLGWYLARRKRLANALGSPLHRLPGQRTITKEGEWVAIKIGGLTRRLSRPKPDKPADDR